MSRKPSVQKKYSEPPKTEKDLQELQEEYIKENCPQEIKDKYFLLLRSYARSITLATIKRKGLLLLPERVDEICTDATLYLLQQYSKKGWKVLASFAGALRWKVLEAMYGHGNKEEESTTSLNKKFSDERDSKEVEDYVSYIWSSNQNFDDIESSISYVDEIYKTVERCLQELSTKIDYPFYLKLLCGVTLFFRKSFHKNQKDSFLSLLNKKEQEIFNLVLLELKNRSDQFLI